MGRRGGTPGHGLDGPARRHWGCGSAGRVGQRPGRGLRLRDGRAGSRRRIHVRVRLAEGRKLLEARPHELLGLGIGEALLEPAERHDAHAQELHHVTRLERGGLEALELDELVGEGLAQGRRGRLVQGDDRGGVEGHDGEAQRAGHERVAVGVAGGEAHPVLGRVAECAERCAQGLAVRAGEQRGRASWGGAGRGRRVGGVGVRGNPAVRGALLRLALQQQHLREGVARHDHARLGQVAKLGPRLVQELFAYAHATPLPSLSPYRGAAPARTHAPARTRTLARCREREPRVREPRVRARRRSPAAQFR